MSSSTSSTGDQGYGHGHKGFPIQIIKVKDDRSLELNTDALKSVLLKSSVKDKPMVVISVAGDYRKGEIHL
jgi:atlastin